MTLLAGARRTAAEEGQGLELRLLSAREVLEARREAEGLARGEAEAALCANACLLARALEHSEDHSPVFSGGREVLSGLTVEEIAALAGQWDAFRRESDPGLDLNRDAVALAARSAERAAWFVADLKRLPVQNAAADVVLNVFSPADYGEFRRVLTPDGELLKVVPGPDYLREVRSAVAGYLRGGAYDNASVLAHLRAHAEVISEMPVRSVAPLSPADSHDFLRMTPMTFSVPAEALEKIVLEKITIDVRVLRCRMR